MITLKELKKTINLKLSGEFPDIEITSLDVKEGFNRPSFFVQFDGVTKDDRLYNFNRDLTVRIYYFPSDRYNYSLEVLDIIDRLESVFKLNIPVMDRVLTIVDADNSVTDGVLLFNINLNYLDSYGYEDQGEPMQELEYKAK